MTKIPSLNTVEIEVGSRCNRKCSYCPVSILPVPKVPVFMSDEVLNKLISELIAVNFAGRISYHFYNEPLLRRDLPSIIKNIKVMLPDSYQVLFTNGDFLNEEKYLELIQAGIDLIQVTSHSLKSHPDREKQVVYYPSDLHLTNRGGALQHLPVVTNEILSMPCYAPSEMLIVTANGDVVLCYEDSKRENVMGNIMEQSLFSIWYSEEFVKVRNAVSIGDRVNGRNICKACTNRYHDIPGISYIPAP